jgi:serine/threonine protein kinase
VLRTDAGSASGRIRHASLSERDRRPRRRPKLDLSEGQTLTIGRGEKSDTKLSEKFGTLKMLDWKFALTVGVHIAQALEVAHEKHIIHRNISPESIMIRMKDHIAKLGDMMLANALEGNQ